MARDFSSRWLVPLARPVARAGRWLWYRYRLARGEAAGEVTYVWSEWRPPERAVAGRLVLMPNG